jgi:hypothetical protein
MGTARVGALVILRSLGLLALTTAFAHFTVSKTAAFVQRNLLADGLERLREQADKSAPLWIPLVLLRPCSLMTIIIESL